MPAFVEKERGDMFCFGSVSSVCICMYVHVCTYVCMYVHVCTYVRMHVYMFVASRLDAGTCGCGKGGAWEYF